MEEDRLSWANDVMRLAYQSKLAFFRPRKGKPIPQHNSIAQLLSKKIKIKEVKAATFIRQSPYSIGHPPESSH